MQKVPPAEHSTSTGEFAARTAEPDREFWKPILPKRDDAARLNETRSSESKFPELRLKEDGEICAGCGARFIESAQFCYGCGESRSPSLLMNFAARPRHFIRDGLSSGFFIAGLLFAAIAALLGWIYSPSGYDGWQAVQSWRIEWLLAAIAAFLGCICVKPKS